MESFGNAECSVQVVWCSVLAASASILQQINDVPEAAVGRQHSAQDGVQHTNAQSVSRSVCIPDGPIQVRIPALLSLHDQHFSSKQRPVCAG